MNEKIKQTSKEHPWLKTRRQNIQKLKQMIEEDQPIEHDALIAYGALEIGASAKTINEYLRILVDAKFVVWDGNNKSWRMSKKEEQKN